MSYFGYGMSCLGLVLLMALVAWRVGKLRHRVVQAVAVVLCGAAMYCHVQADIHGEYHRLAQQIADPLTKKWLQPFALSDFGQLLIAALKGIIHVLDVTVAFIDNYALALTLVVTGIIVVVIWVRGRL